MREPSVDCPLTPCIKLLAGAWTLEIIYFLRIDSLRFGELRRALSKVSSKVLTARLRELEKKGFVSRKSIPSNPPMVEYSLTSKGRELLPVIDALSAATQRLLDKYGAI